MYMYMIIIVHVISIIITTRLKCFLHILSLQKKPARDARTDKNIKVLEALEKAFDTICCATLPYPGKTVASCKVEDKILIKCRY